MNEETIYSQAMERQSSEHRSRFLDEACGNDPQLRARVEARLSARTQSQPGGDLFGDLPYDDTLGDSQFDESVDLQQISSELPLDVGLAGQPRANSVFDGPTDFGPRGPQPGGGEGAAKQFWDAIRSHVRVSGLGLRLDQYQIVEVLGRGGMGVVLRAIDLPLQRVVALKVLAYELHAHPSAPQRFLREARAVAAVSHDNVIKIHTIREDTQPLMIVMEYIDGPSLQEEIRQRGSFDVCSILRIGAQIAAGLAAAHEQGLIHRDIKPSNILLEGPQQRVKLTDFGLARAIDDVSLTSPGQIFGTPLYMSPEQARGDRVDFRGDLFSLGGVLYTMCTGRPAFLAESGVAVAHRVIHDQATPIDDINAEIPGWLCAIIEQLMEKHPQDRFASAQQVADLFSRYTDYLEHPGSVPMPKPIPRRIQSISQATARSLGGIAKRMSLLGGISVLWGVVGLVAFRPSLSLWFVSLYLSTLTGLLGLVGAYHVMTRNSRKLAVVGCAAMLLPFNPMQLLASCSTWRMTRSLISDEIQNYFRPHSWLEFLKLPAALCLAILSLFTLGVVILQTLAPSTDVSRIRTIESDGQTTIIYIDR
jgi:serine/threonine protein kinase